MRLITTKTMAAMLMFSTSAMAGDKDDYLFTDRYDIIPDERNKIVNKRLKLKPDIEANYFIRRNSLPDRSTLFVLFHGGINNAVEFMQNTNLHGRITEEEYDFMLVPSNGSKDYLSSYENNDIVLNSILSEARVLYRNIIFLGYAEGGTYMTDFYCRNKDSRNLRSLNHIWNINGTMPVDCSIGDDVNYNIFYGDGMVLSDYYNDDYYLDYDDLSVALAGDNCSITGFSTAHGSSTQDIYLEQAQLRCNKANDINIFKAINIKRNFPYTNKLEMDGFKGNELPNFDMINFIKRINYI